MDINSLLHAIDILLPRERNDAKAFYGNLESIACYYNLPELHDLRLLIEQRESAIRQEAGVPDDRTITMADVDKLWKIEHAQQVEDAKRTEETILSMRERQRGVMLNAIDELREMMKNKKENDG